MRHTKKHTHKRRRRWRRVPRNVLKEITSSSIYHLYSFSVRQKLQNIPNSFTQNALRKQQQIRFSPNKMYKNLRSLSISISHRLSAFFPISWHHSEHNQRDSHHLRIIWLYHFCVYLTRKIDHLQPNPRRASIWLVIRWNAISTCALESISLSIPLSLSLFLPTNV